MWAYHTARAHLNTSEQNDASCRSRGRDGADDAVLAHASTRGPSTLHVGQAAGVDVPATVYIGEIAVVIVLSLLFEYGEDKLRESLEEDNNEE